ncbi:MAG: DUF3341 domain-containing protein [Phycisphaerales bacterium]|nr:DUF3341 domain-containing protein [Phycisphaerales bacterium]
MAKQGKIYKTPAGEVVYGVMAEFATPADTFHAAEKLRDAGYRNWDVYAPFPIHGIDEAMGLKPSKLPLLAGVIGLSGACVGFFFQWWVSTSGYTTIVQGKPAGAWESFVPVTFEIGILFTAFTCILGMLAFNALPMWYHPLLKKERFLRVSDDRFVICVESRDPGFDPEKTRKMLESVKGYNIDLVQD